MQCQATIMTETNLPSNIQLDSASTAKQFVEFLSTFNRVSELCFNDCIHNFTTRKVSDAERSCSLTCLEKYLKCANRISMRFQEIQFASSGNISPTLAAAETMKK